MSPETAKQLWCPFTRVAIVEGMAANRTASIGRGYTDISEETRCLAQGCMAWRWTKMTPPDGYCSLTRRDDL